MTLKKSSNRAKLGWLLFAASMAMPFLLTSVWAGESKPKYVATTIRLPDDTSYFRKNAAPDYWAFSSYYENQQDGAACGIASMTMLVNAAKVHQPGTTADALASQKALVDKTKVNYSRGLDLEKLNESIVKATAAFGLNATTQVFHADGTPEFTKKIRELLIKNEKSDRNFIIANFLQSVFTGDPEGGGHISPVGAFDATKNRVLIMDVNREYYEPYWVSLETFIKGLNTEDSSVKKTRGLIFVELK